MTEVYPCPICGAIAPEVGRSPYRASLERWLQTPILECRSCDIFFRKLDDADRLSHFYAASYVQPEGDRAFWDERYRFLSFILNLATCRLSNAPWRLLDVGCAYGHLLELARRNGVDAEGIEINENLVALCRRKGLTVWSGLDRVTQPADVITLIDSLYYLPRPVESMQQLHNKLSPDGILIIRLINRNWFIHARAAIIHRYNFGLLGDAEIGYSVRGIRRLLADTGFRITAIFPDSGAGKRNALKIRAIGALTLAATNLTFRRLFLTPGIIVLARPSWENATNWFMSLNDARQKIERSKPGARITTNSGR
jgi:SAM-dependent methyltransferase